MESEVDLLSLTFMRGRREGTGEVLVRQRNMERERDGFEGPLRLGMVREPSPVSSKDRNKERRRERMERP